MEHFRLHNCQRTKSLSTAAAWHPYNTSNAQDVTVKAVWNIRGENCEFWCMWRGDFAERICQQDALRLAITAVQSFLSTQPTGRTVEEMKLEVKKWLARPSAQT